MFSFFSIKVLHYAQELFEGMKAYRGIDNEIRMFRPMHNMTRMLVSARRSCLPEFDPHELVHCIRRLIQIDQVCVSTVMELQRNVLQICSSFSAKVQPYKKKLDPL